MRKVIHKNDLLVGVILGVINIQIVNAESLNIENGENNIINGKSVYSIDIKNNGTKAIIENTVVEEGYIQIQSGAKVNIKNITLNSTNDYMAIKLSGVGHIVNAITPNASTSLEGENLKITSKSDGIISTASSYINLTDVNIRSSGKGLNLNGSVTPNGIGNITKINNFNILSSDTGVEASFGAEVHLSNGDINTEKDNVDGVQLHGANNEHISPIQTTAYMTNVNVHTKGDKSFGVNSFQMNYQGAVSYWNNSHIITEGKNSHGVYGNYSGNTIEISNNSTVKTFGDNAYGISSIGRANILLDKSQVITEGSGAHGAMVKYAGNISLKDGEITTKGADAHGIYMLFGVYGNSDKGNGSKVDLQHSSIVSDQGYGIATESGYLQVNVLDGSLLKGETGLMNVQDYTGSASPSWDQGVTTVNLLVDGGSLVSGAVKKTDTAVANIILKNDSVWGFDSDSTLTNLTTDKSTIRFISNIDGTKSTNNFSTLTIEDDYAGNSGLIEMNATLNGDYSLTDKLVINGEATGTTDVVVNNVGGKGASTVEGIELIKTGGSTSDAFKQSGRIIAGSYEYHLQQGTASGNNTNSWYLTSKYNDSEKVTRPESGSYIGNLQAAGTMFNTTLKDRQGGGTYINPVTGEVYTSSVWARSVGSHQKGNISGGQSDYKANKFVFQMGGDVMNGSLQDNDEYHIGVMAGYGNQHNHSHNHVSGYNSKGSLWGYSAGLYGTWYQDTKTNTGLYVDSWVLYNWFNNSVHGDELAYENYKTKGFTVSIESGYAFKLGTYPSYGETSNTVYITPQAQAIWSGVKADNHKESNGTNVEGVGNNNVQTRLGVRLSIINEGKNLETVPVRPLMPFVEANWIYTSKEYGVSMNNEKAYFEGTRNIGEVKAGLEADLSHNVTVWGNIAQQFGSHSYQNTQGMLGVKYAF